MLYIGMQIDIFSDQLIIFRVITLQKFFAYSIDCYNRLVNQIIIYNKVYISRYDKEGDKLAWLSFI